VSLIEHSLGRGHLVAGWKIAIIQKQHDDPMAPATKELLMTITATFYSLAGVVNGLSNNKFLIST
jgi:hypothetical protein